MIINPTMAKLYRYASFIFPGFNFRPLMAVLKYINCASQ